MVNLHLQKTHDAIDSAIKEAKNKYKSLAKNGFVEFIQKFYEFVPYHEISSYSTQDLCSIAAGIFEFIEKRKTGETKVRIFNPEKKNHGWESPYTIIEIANDDMPFIVDSITAEITKHGLEIYSLAHPVINIERDSKGKIANNSNLKNEDKHNKESVIHLQISNIDNDEFIKSLEDDLLKTLKTVRLSVEDWKTMLNKVSYVSTELTASYESLKSLYKDSNNAQINENIQEIKEFLEWLKANNFVFLGYLEYSTDKKNPVVKSSELGVAKVSLPEIPPTISTGKKRF